MQKLSTKKPGQDFDGQEKARPCPDPALAPRIESAAGDDAVQVRMELELLSPGVEYGGEADLRPEVLRIACDGLQRLGRTLEEQTVELRFVAQGQRT